ncbi:MAG: hypothetical protein D6734_01125 [Candidatus Schekmanbacteria bacterium]|nr:MAG: hypothetical protein D6734_01125 [Candidatus Schekmanbacteria bacterium]
MNEYLKRNLSILICFMVFVFLACAGFSFAEEAGEAAHHVNVAKEIYKWINFLILAGALFFVLKKIVPEFFSARVENIKRTLEESRRAEKEANEKLKIAEEKIKSLNKEIEIIRANAKAAIEKEKKRILEEANEKIARIEEQNEQNIRQAIELSVKELKEEIIKQATVLAEDMIKGRITPEERKKLFNNYVKQLGEINE